MRNQQQNNTPEDKDQRLVRTPYGKGLVVRTRFRKREETVQSTNEVQKYYEYFSPNPKGIQIHEIRLLDWQSATLYSSANLTSITPEVGHDVISQYGRGIISEIIDPNPDDVESKLPKKFLISLTSWRLANRSLVKCYLTESSFCVVRRKLRREMNAYDKVTYAQNRKKEAAVQFANAEYNPALLSYSDAVNAVRYVQHDSSSSNEIRADLLEVMVTCNNNAATCCIKLKQWNEAKRFATNAMILLDALYNKRGMKIHGILNKDGITDAKLFGEWRGKSLTNIAKTWMHLKDYEQGIQWLKKAKESINPYILHRDVDMSPAKKKIVENHQYYSSQTILTRMDKEINKLLHHSLQKKKAIDKKEKLRAKAMFGGSSFSNPTKEMPKLSVNDGERKEASPTKDSNTKNKDLENKALKDTKNIKDVTENGHHSRPSILRRPSITTNGLNDSRNNNERRVQFGEGVKKANEYIDEDDEIEEPWYKEHKEALIIAGTFLAGAALLLRPKK